VRPLTLEQVIAAGRRATRRNAQVSAGRTLFTVDYLPDNPPQERFRVSGGAFCGLSFGPGGEQTPQDGWQHEEGCDCEFCRPNTAK
jgi:hypothetical protein